MKFKYVALTSLSLLLASCSFQISIVDESHDKGLSHEEKIYEFYDGDELDISLYNSHQIIIPKNMGEADFNGHTEVDSETSSEKEVTVGEEILEFLGPQDSILKSIANPQFVGKTNKGLKVGYLANYIDGQITFNFNEEIAAVSISASPRAALVTNKYGTSLEIDQETGISVNNSKYVLLKSEFEEIEDVTDTECNFLLSNPTDSINIAVGRYRAEISNITIYTLK